MTRQIKIVSFMNLFLIALYVLEIHLPVISDDMVEFLLVSVLLTSIPPFILAANNPRHNTAHRKWAVVETILWFITAMTIIKWGIESIFPETHPGTYMDVVAETVVAASAGVIARSLKERFRK